jgi:predicted DNA-binding transcriptional regulator YafY
MSRLEGRTSRLRQLEELLASAPQGLTALEIAGQLGVDRRTVYRDLDFLSTQDIPLWQDEGRFGLNRTRYLATVRLSFHEALALVLAGLLLSRTIDERNVHVIAALRRLATIMPTTLTPHLERAANRVQGRSVDQPQVGVLETIAEGWATNHKVRVLYRSPRSGEVRPRVIAPYLLEPTAVGLYVIGHDDWARDIRTFKLERLEHAEILDEPYEVPADFNPEAYLATSWGIMTSQEMFEVVLRFSSAAVSPVRERCWHPTQAIEPLPDGGCLFRVRVSEPLEMQPWIRSWGAQVEVLSPDWLRERVADELRRASDRYWLAPPDDGFETAESGFEIPQSAIEQNDPAGDHHGSTARSSPTD